MKHYWFTPKKYGCGFYPSSVQGWIIILSTCILICLVFFINIPIEQNKIIASKKDWLKFFFDFFLIHTFYIILVKDRVKGGVKWRWGKSKKV